jgi:isopropylmalate/homocitrate/citramalate synthase
MRRNTTLRDGIQGMGISFWLANKIDIARRLPPQRRRWRTLKA